MPKKQLLSTQYHRKKKKYVQQIIPFTPILAKKKGVRECTAAEAAIVEKGGIVPAQMPEDGMSGHTQMFIPDKLVPKVKAFVERYLEQVDAPAPLPPSEEFPVEDGIQTVQPAPKPEPMVDPTGLELPDESNPQYAPNPDPEADLLEGEEILTLEGNGQEAYAAENVGQESQDGVREFPIEVVKMQKARSKNDLEIFATEHLDGTVVIDRTLNMDVIKTQLTKAYKAKNSQPEGGVPA